MSPSAYKARYERLQVPLANDGTAEVRVNQYRRRGQAGQDVDEAASKAFFDSLRKHHVDMQLRVDPGARSFRILHRSRDSSFKVTEQTQTGPENVGSDFLKQLSVMARYVLVGKGAPSIASSCFNSSTIGSSRQTVCRVTPTKRWASIATDSSAITCGMPTADKAGAVSALASTRKDPMSRSTGISTEGSRSADGKI